MPDREKHLFKLRYTPTVNLKIPNSQYNAWILHTERYGSTWSTAVLHVDPLLNPNEPWIQQGSFIACVGMIQAPGLSGTVRVLAVLTIQWSFFQW